jgi:NADPH:quinone reductase-like Zn-dependent oxidoreductase
MKAFVYRKYGLPDVLRLEEIENPVPQGNEILVRVHAVALNTADWYSLRGKPFLLRFEAGLLRPRNRVLGFDVAGRVEAVGPDAGLFRPGDEVFGDLSENHGGGLAEYLAAPEDVFVRKPPRLTFEEAAAVPMAGVTALQGLVGKGQIQPDQKVLIYGASGGVGTFAVQIARAFGGDVTAVCSTGKMEMVRGLGADHVIDYTREDFAQNGQLYDLIFSVNGYRPIADYRASLSPRGVYVCGGGSLRQIFEAGILGGRMSEKNGKKLFGLAARPDRKDLATVGELLEAGKVAPVIDFVYPFEETPAAFRYLGDGHAGGKVVISLEHENA